MKGLKTTVTMAIAIGLLAGSAVGVAAQDDSAPSGQVDLTYVTGGISDALSCRGEVVEFLTVELYSCPGQVVVASDPRLSGDVLEVSIGGDFKDRDRGERVSVPGQGELLVTSTWFEISNEGGAWKGAWGPTVQVIDVIRPANDSKKARNRVRRLGSFVGGSDGPIVLDGEGAYDGLSAYIFLPRRGGDRDDPKIGLPPNMAAGTPFQAVIVNREYPGFPTEEQIAEARLEDQFVRDEKERLDP